MSENGETNGGLPSMRVESIEIHNYRLFKHTVMKDIPRLAVLVGKNGSGKSTLFDVFSFLKDALTQNVAKAVAKGSTIKMFAYLVLLYDPKPFPLLAIEEPENQLYPHLMQNLAEEFRSYAQRGGQVFVSTHSPEFLNGFNLDEIYVLNKEKGFTEIKKVDTDPLIKNLIEEGDLLGGTLATRFL